MQAPVFPSRQINIKKTGAVEGKISTDAIQKAIDRIARQGGGTITVPKGHWLTGRLILKSNTNLCIEEGAVLEFSGHIKDYLPVVATRNEGADIMSLGAMIYAYNEENIAVTGNGTLLAPDYDCEISKKQNGGVTLDMEQKLKTDKLSDGSNGRVFMPTFIGPVKCSNILIEGVTLKRSIFWNIVPVYSKNIIIRNITVSSHGHGRTDGIDIDSSQDVLIENSTLDCGDDCFTLKSGRGEEAVDLGIPTENVVIRNCHIKRGTGGITIGSETAGMVRNIYAENIIMDNPVHAIYIKTRRPRGGGGENIWIKNITVNKSRSAAINIDMLGSERFVGELGRRMPEREVNKLTPCFRNIFINDFEINSCKTLLKAKGLPESPIENLIIKGIKSNCKTISMHDTGKFEISFNE
ncbi:glycoside hydrolase family 28 protein [Xylanibacter muris]|nr:glycoside hydrolase family 28 protein [Xylanibacter muris]